MYLHMTWLFPFLSSFFFERERDREKERERERESRDRERESRERERERVERERERERESRERERERESLSLSCEKKREREREKKRKNNKKEREAQEASITWQDLLGHGASCQKTSRTCYQVSHHMSSWPVISVRPRATTTTQTHIWCNILIALVLSRFCLPQWKRLFRCGSWSSQRWSSSCRCRPFDDSNLKVIQAIWLHVLFPTFRLSINSCVLTEWNWLKLIENDWSWLKLTETDWRWQKIDGNGLKVDENLGENQWNCRKLASEIFRMEGGAKTHLTAGLTGIVAGCWPANYAAQSQRWLLPSSDACWLPRNFYDRTSTIDHSSLSPPKRNLVDLKLKVDVSLVDAKGFLPLDPHSLNGVQTCHLRCLRQSSAPPPSRVNFSDFDTVFGMNFCEISDWDNQALGNVTLRKFHQKSRLISRHPWQRKTEKLFISHFCRVDVLIKGVV